VEEKIIKCRNLETARLLFFKFIEVNEQVYFDPKTEAASVAMAAILKDMLTEGIISEKDFQLSEHELMEKIQNSPFSRALGEIGPHMNVSLSPTPNHRPPALRKLRYIDPQIIGYRGTLTDHCFASKERLQSYLSKTPTKLYYNI